MIQVALFVAAAISFLFALIIFVNDTKSLLFRLYFLLGILSTLWMVSNGLAITGPFDLPAEAQLQAARFITPFALGTSLTFYLFLRYFTKRKLGVIASLPIVLSVVVSLFSFTDFNVYLGPSGEIMLGDLYPFYLVAVLMNIIFLFHALYSKNSYRVNIKMQIRYLRLGALVAVLPTLALGAVLPLFSDSELSNIGPLFSLSFLFFAGVAIVRHHLFDIKLAAVRTTAYTLTVIWLACIYFVLAYIVSLVLFGGDVRANTSLDPINIVIALILVFIFQPLKRFFDKITDSIFYRDTYSTEQFIAEVGRLLTTTTDLRGLLEALSKHVASTLKVDQASFVLHYVKDGEHRVSAGTHKHGKLPKYDVDLLTEYATKTKSRIIQTDLYFEKNVSVWRMLKSHKIGLVLPLHQGEKVIGFLLLGERLTSNFTKKDINVLLTISNELVIGIQNTLSVHQLKELNETLQQRIDVATQELRSSNAQLKHLDEIKDEFMSIASHQLRTPLTSVKGYISMVIEGDVGDVTPQQKKLLTEAFNSSERMVRLIADFLNVSRLQTGRFVVDKASVDLHEMVRQEVEALKVIAVGRDITLKFSQPRKALMVNADEAKLRQVIMNFIDNAIYYSHAGATVQVSLAANHGAAVYKVVDHGIGVPASEQRKLFGKFFRANNARKQRPDGTGVGLFLAKKVITAHGGGLIFYSEEGKGSTFGFVLPLGSDKDTDDTNDRQDDTRGDTTDD